MGTASGEPPQAGASDNESCVVRPVPDRVEWVRHKEVGKMLVMFTARRLKPGAWDQFRRAWDPGEEKPPGFQRAYHARNVRDEDEVISFGLFDMTIDDYHAWRGQAESEENARVDRVSAFVENEHVSGVYEVVDEVAD